MDSDERDICNYLKSCPGQFVSSAEIGRRAAGRKRYHREPEWHVSPLNRLVEDAVVETDGNGRYRVKPPPPPKEKARRWISPQIRRILEANGRFTHVLEVGDDDEEWLKRLREDQWDSGKK